ncbi:MAG: hypothetical protein KGQ48_09290 [Bradyrhizobium sp.]|nr:hypothetical protein [Bradyrhizobium sp.]
MREGRVRRGEHGKERRDDLAGGAIPAQREKSVRLQIHEPVERAAYPRGWQVGQGQKPKKRRL